MPDVKVSQLNKQFGDNTVLEDVDFTIRDGEFFTLLGPSGCGKSTTLNCIAGLEQPTSGTIAVGDETFVDSSRRASFHRKDETSAWSSSPTLCGRTRRSRTTSQCRCRSARSARTSSGVSSTTPWRRSDFCICAAAIRINCRAGSSSASPWRGRLSTHPRFCCSMNRYPISTQSCASRPEPGSSGFSPELGITTVYVTHDQDEALALSDRIAVMSRGHMIQVGTPKEIYESPATAEVAAFVGRCNFLEASVEEVSSSGAVVTLAANGESLRVETDHTAQVGQTVTVAIRPENLRLCTTDTPVLPGVNTLDTEVLTESYLGSRFEYDLKLGDHVVQVVCDRGGLTGPVRLSVEPDSCLLYPEADVLSDEAQQLLTV